MPTEPTAPPVPADPGYVTSFSAAEVADLTARFEVFEALHHQMQICNPMAESDLDAVADHLAADLSDDGMAIDVACGYGELLFRLAARRPRITGVGVDLSPWMLRSAVAAVPERAPSADLAWYLSDGAQVADHLSAQACDVACCLGASWIWHGLNGTVRAMASLVRPGGRVAIGDMRTRHGVTSDDLPEKFRRVTGLAEQEALFGHHGLRIVDRIDTADEFWDAYIARTRECATSWHSSDYVDVQREWEADHERDLPLLTWSVWIADRVG